MSQTDLYLRLMSQADKEMVVTAVDVFGTPAKFTSQLTLGYSRKGAAGYNSSDAASGEIVFGPAGVTAATGMVIPKGAIFDFPISTAVDIYFCNTISGETGNLRVVEIA